MAKKLSRRNIRVRKHKNPKSCGKSKPVSDSNYCDLLHDQAKADPQKYLDSVLAEPPVFHETSLRKKLPEPLPDDQGELLAEWFDKFRLFQAIFIPGIDDREVETPAGRITGGQAWRGDREVAWRRMRRLSDKLAGLLPAAADAAPLTHLSGYMAWGLVPISAWDSALATCKWMEARPPQPPGNNPSPTENQARLSPRELAEKHGVTHNALRKRLDRWRYEHDAGYIEVSNAAKNEPRFLYDESAVMPVIDDLKAKSAGQKRPTDGQQKKF